MLEERGRGAVLVGVARVDAALETMLQAVMAPGPSKGDGLFQPERPLGSLGAKVALAHRLGLIDDPVERALSVLRKLRNAGVFVLAQATTNISGRGSNAVGKGIPQGHELPNIVISDGTQRVFYRLQTVSPKTQNGALPGLCCGKKIVEICFCPEISETMLYCF